MKRIRKIILRVSIVLFIITVIAISTIKTANYLYEKNVVKELERCYKCEWQTMFMCYGRHEINPCEQIDGRIVFYFITITIYLIIFLIVQYKVEKNTNFNIENWIKAINFK